MPSRVNAASLPQDVAERERISPIACELSLEHELVVSALPVSEAAFDSEETPLFLNARREGIVVR